MAVLAAVGAIHSVKAMDNTSLTCVGVDKLFVCASDSSIQDVYMNAATCIRNHCKVLSSKALGQHNLLKSAGLSLEDMIGRFACATCDSY